MSTKKLTKSIRQLNNVEDNPNHYLQNYHKLVKMKKLLANTEQKMFNRIRLFQKASEKALKKKQNQNNFFSKFQQIKKKENHLPKYHQQLPQTRQERPKTQQKSRKLKAMHQNQNFLQFIVPVFREKEIKTRLQSPSNKVLIEKINEQRLKNAKLIKQDKERNKIIIEQRRKKELTRKLESANMIRRERQKAKMIKQQMQNQKHEEYRKFIEIKYAKQKQQFAKIQSHLQQLQQKEKQALINWKKTVQQQ